MEVAVVCQGGQLPPLFFLFAVGGEARACKKMHRAAALPAADHRVVASADSSRGRPRAHLVRFCCFFMVRLRGVLAFWKAWAGTWCLATGLAEVMWKKGRGVGVGGREEGFLCHSGGRGQSCCARVRHGTAASAVFFGRWEGGGRARRRCGRIVCKINTLVRTRLRARALALGRACEEGCASEAQ